MPLSELRRSPLVEQATERLRERLVAGEWPVGGRLPSEAELGRALGVGRSTVREAVRALVAAGLVESRQGSGTFVLSHSPVRELELRLHRAAAVDVYEVRVAVEIEAARLAALRRTDQDLAALDRTLSARQAAAADAAFVDADLAFHHAVVAAAHNPVFTDLFTGFTAALRQTLLHIRADPGLRQPVDHGVATAAHLALADAIRDRDPAAAVAATRANVEGTLAQLHAALH